MGATTDPVESNKARHRLVSVSHPTSSYRYGGLRMSEKQVTWLSDQEYVEFEIQSRDEMRIRIAFLGLVPDTDKVSIGIEVLYKSEFKDKGEL